MILSRDEDTMAAANRSLDLIIDTVAAPHDLNPYFRTLRVDGAPVPARGCPLRRCLRSTQGR